MDPGLSTFAHIRIRTPSPLLAPAPPDAAYFNTNVSAIPRPGVKRKRSLQLVTSSPRAKMACNAGNTGLYQTQTIERAYEALDQVVVRIDNLPYFQFLDSFRSIKIGGIAFPCTRESSNNIRRLFVSNQILRPGSIPIAPSLKPSALGSRFRF